jgi:diadenosine tetraphosphate (Ap4A) HIT family hydrolase
MMAAKPPCQLCLGNELLTTKVLAAPGKAYLTVKTDGNYLIIPKRHIVTTRDDRWHDAATDMSRLMEEARNHAGRTMNINFSLNVGPDAGQRLEHLHYWGVPRSPDQPATGWGLNALIKVVNYSGMSPQRVATLAQLEP